MKFKGYDVKVTIMANQPSITTTPSEAAQAVKDAVKDVKIPNLKDVSVSDAITQIKEATSHVAEAVGKFGSASTASAKSHLADGKAKAIELEERAEDAMRAHPLVAVGVAFAAGWLVSKLFQRN